MKIKMSMRPFSSYPPEIAAAKRDHMSKIASEGWKNRDKNGLGTRNGKWKDRSKKKMSKSMKKTWESGVFDNRVHGITGKFAAKHHNWVWGKHIYREILSQHEVEVCRICGKKEELVAHHINENRSDYLLSNLLWACTSCHRRYFHSDYICCDHACSQLNPSTRFFGKISKRFVIKYAYRKRGKLRRHSGELKVTINGIINPEGPIEDFFDIDAFLENAVLKKLYHSRLKRNPTPKRLLVWIWKRLEKAGLKGLYEIELSEATNSGSAILNAKSMLETHGWNRVKNKWKLIRKSDVR
jgi:hypothetical protein